MSRRSVFNFPRGMLKGKQFSSAKELQDAFSAAPVEMLSVTVSAECSAVLG